MSARSVEVATGSIVQSPPSRWSCCENVQMTSQKAMKIFAMIFLVSLAAVAVTAIIINVPNAKTALYSIFTVAAAAGLAGFIVALVKRWRQGENAELLCSNAGKVMQVFAAIFAVAAVGITVTALITHFPHASTAIYAVFGVATGVSFIAFMLMCARKTLDHEPGTPERKAGKPPHSPPPPPANSTPVRPLPAKPASTPIRGSAYDGGRTPVVEHVPQPPPPVTPKGAGVGGAYDGGGNPFDLSEALSHKA